MSWAEFLIRSIGFKRQREYEMSMFREVAYSSYVSGWMGKTKPPSKEKFWPIGSKKTTGVSPEQMEAFKRAREQYLKDKKSG